MDASETPLRLATSAIVSRSVSRKIRTICSSEYRLFFIQCPRLRGIISKLDWFENPWAGHLDDKSKMYLVETLSRLSNNELVKACSVLLELLTERANLHHVKSSNNFHPAVTSLPEIIRFLMLHSNN